MQRVAIALAAGLTLLAVAIGLTLLQSPTVLARKSASRSKEAKLATTAQAANYCQAGELLPRGASAIRLSLAANAGPSVRVLVSAGGHTITGGTRGSGWTGKAVTVPVNPSPRTVSGVTVCASVQPRDEQVIVVGALSPRAIAAYDGRQKLAGRMWIEYLRPGTRTWASLAKSTARRMGLGRTPAGTWNALLAIELLAAVAIIASGLVLMELREPA